MSRKNWKTKNPGQPFRVQSNAAGFDEVVVGDWLHIERMDTREWWVRIGQTDFMAIVDRNDARNVKLVYQGGPELRARSASSREGGGEG